jgi:hypothetical protein
MALELWREDTNLGRTRGGTTVGHSQRDLRAAEAVCSKEDSELKLSSTLRFVPGASEWSTHLWSADG